MAINVIQKTLIKQKIREIPIFVNPAENQDPCVKTIMNLDCHLGFMKIQHSCCFMKKMAWKAFIILLFYNRVQSADGFKQTSFPNQATEDRLHLKCVLSFFDPQTQKWMASSLHFSISFFEVILHSFHTVSISSDKPLPFFPRNTFFLCPQNSI